MVRELGSSLLLTLGGFEPLPCSYVWSKLYASLLNYFLSISLDPSLMWWSLKLIWTISPRKVLLFPMFGAPPLPASCVGFQLLEKKSRNLVAECRLTIGCFLWFCRAPNVVEGFCSQRFKISSKFCRFWLSWPVEGLYCRCARVWVTGND